MLSLRRSNCIRLRLKCDGTCAETRFRLSVKWTSPFKSAGASVQLTTGSRGVRISGSNAGYIMFRGSVKGTGCPLHSPVCPSLPLPCVPCAIIFQLDSTYRSSGNRGPIYVQCYERQALSVLQPLVAVLSLTFPNSSSLPFSHGSQTSQP